MKLCILFSSNIIKNFNQLRNIFNIYDITLLFHISLKENIKNNLNNNYFQYNNIYSKNIVYYHDDNLLKILNLYDILFLLETPVLNYFNIDKDIDINPKIYFLHHGVTAMFPNNSIEKKRLIKTFRLWMNNEKVNIITCCTNLHTILTNLNIKNLYKINSLPQFYLNDKYLNNKYINDIVIFPTIFGLKHDINELNKIINILNNRFNYKNIIIKLKSKCESHEFIQIQIKNLKKKYKNINFEFGIQNSSYYFNSFLTIILDGGTTFMESLILNKKTIMHKINVVNIHYQNYPIEFNKLLISYDLNTFTDNLDKINNETYFDEEYNKDIKKLIKFHIGVEKISNFEEDFKENIIYPYLVEKNNNLKKIYNKLINKQ